MTGPSDFPFDDADDSSDGDEDARFDEMCDEIAAIVLVRLRSGPRPMANLVQLVRSELGSAVGGYSDEVLSDIIDDAALDTGDIWISPSGVAYLISAVMDGLVLTHVVSADELARDMLDVSPDLEVIDLGLGDVTHRRNLSPITMVFPESGLRGVHSNGSFIGPDGWLAGVVPGEIVALRRSLAALEVATVGSIGDGSSEVAMLRSTVEQLCNPGASVEISDLVLNVVSQNETAFRAPVRPLAELIIAARLRAEGSWVGRDEERFTTPARLMLDLRFEHLAKRYQMDKCCEAAFRRVKDAFEIHCADSSAAVDTRRLVDDLEHGATIPALGDWMLRNDTTANPFAGSFASALTGDRRTAGAGHYLRARSELLNGNAVQALDDARQSFTLEPGASAAGQLYADLLADSGEPMRSLQVRKRVPGLAHDNHVNYLSSLLKPFLSAGRNDSCPCGSGRKSKQCCTNSPRLSTRLRARIRWHQVMSFSMEPASIGVIRNLVEECAREEATDAELKSLSADMFVHDLVTVEGGLIARYRDQRGELLSPEERGWLEAWQHTPRSLYEVLDSGPGWFTGRDVILGGEISAVLVAFAEQSGFGDDVPTLHVGSYVCARVSDLGDEKIVVGASLTVTSQYRESLIAAIDRGGDVVDLLQWYSWLSAPPRVHNREGEDLLVISARFARRGMSWASGAEALNRIFPIVDGYDIDIDDDDIDDEHDDDDIDDEHDGEGSGLRSGVKRVGAGLERIGAGVERSSWTEIVELDGDKVVRGSLRRDGDELIVTTNSLIRFNRLRDTVVAAGFVLIDVEDSVDMEQIVAGQPGGSYRSGSGGSNGSEDESQTELPPEYIDHVQNQMEDRWISESIPMFGGLTVPEALADPTRRDDVLRFLDEMESQPAIGLPAYNHPRLRQKLGIPPR